MMKLYNSFRIIRRAFRFFKRGVKMYGLNSILYGVTFCLAFIAGAYDQNFFVMFLGLFVGPFCVAHSIVELYDAGRKYYKKRRRKRRLKITQERR